MTKHNKTKLLNRYLDGECSHDEIKLVEKLLKSNSNFKEEYDIATSFNEIMHSSPNEELPGYITQRIIHSVKFDDKPKRSSSFMKFIPVTSAALLSFVLGIYISNVAFTNVSTEEQLFQESSEIFATMQVTEYVDYIYSDMEN